eukprot:863871-Amphidinium_carterae.1
MYLSSSQQPPLKFYHQTSNPCFGQSAAGCWPPHFRHVCDLLCGQGPPLAHDHPALLLLEEKQ